MSFRYIVLPLAACSVWGNSQISQSRTAAPNAGLPALTRVDQIRRLNPVQARLRYPIRLRAVVTYIDATNMFVQDATGATWVDRSPKSTPPRPGQFIDLQGVTTQVDFAPDIAEPHWSVIGQASIPGARPVSIEQMASASVDGQWVEVEGVVRSAQILPNDGRLRLSLEMAGDRMVVYIPQHAGIPQGLVYSRVRIHGVCGAIFGSKNQLVGINIFVPTLHHIKILEAGPADSFALVSRPIAMLETFTFGNAPRHLVKVQGVVTARLEGTNFYVADPSGNLYVEASQDILSNTSEVPVTVTFDPDMPLTARGQLGPTAPSRSDGPASC